MTDCRICNRPLFNEPLLVYPGMPDRAQYLPDTAEVGSVTLRVCQCSGCGLVQLDNDPVPYWREEISNAEISKDMQRARQKRIEYTHDYYGYPEFTSYNRLEHLPDPNSYLQKLNGVGIIEVPNFSWFRTNGVFYEFILDHLMYFDENTFRFALQYNGITVYEIEPIHHRYILSAIVKKRSVKDLLNALDSHKYTMAEDFRTILAKHNNIAIYGASHQALTIIPMLGIQYRIRYIVDDIPAKQNKFAPATGIPIYHPDKLKSDPPDAIIVMCGAFSDEVAKRLTHPNLYVLKPSGVERYEAR